MLVKAGADINARDNRGTTPLMKAAATGNLEAAQALVDAGADVNAMNSDGKTAITLAAEKMPNPVIQYLIAHGAKQ